MTTEVAQVIALYWVSLFGLAIWLVRAGSSLERRLRGKTR